MPQHIQGTLLHGRFVLLFRTFHNISNGANLQIHCFLLTLESVMNKEGEKNTLTSLLSLFNATCGLRCGIIIADI